MIELTNECQLACFTCPRDKKDAHDYEFGTMSVSDFKHIFNQFEEGLDTLDLTGLGESLMHPDIFEIIRWVRSRKDIHIYLTTNTVLLNADKRAALHRDPVDTLCISIDGTDQEEFSSVRGQLNYERLKRRVRETVEELRDEMDFILCVVLVSQNLRSMSRFVDLAAELGIDRLSLKPINLVANALPATYYDMFRSTEFDLRAKESIKRGAVLGVDVSVFQIGSYTCTFPWNPIYITWDGFYVPCCAKPFPKREHFGNLLTQHYDEVKNSVGAVRFRSELLSERPPTFCNKCHIMEKTLYRE